MLGRESSQPVQSIGLRLHVGELSSSPRVAGPLGVVDVHADDVHEGVTRIVEGGVDLPSPGGVPLEFEIRAGNGTHGGHDLLPVRDELTRRTVTRPPREPGAIELPSDPQHGRALTLCHQVPRERLEISIVAPGRADGH